MTARIPERVRRATIIRDGRKCVRCGRELWSEMTYEIQVHHRQRSGIGGGWNRPEMNDPANLITLCSGCHGWVHGNPVIATRQGYLCPSWTSPKTWPVFWRLTRWRQPGERWTAASPEDEQSPG